MGHAFQTTETDGRIAVVTFDLPDKKVNTLSRPVLAELAAAHRPTGGADRPPGPPVPRRQAGPVHRRRRPERAGRPGVRHQGAGRRGDRLRPRPVQSHQPAPVPDGGADRRQLHGGRHRARPGDGREARGRGPRDEDRAARGQGRPDPGLGRHAAIAPANRPQCHRDDRLGRARPRREGGRAGAGLRRGPGRSPGRGGYPPHRDPPPRRRMGEATRPAAAAPRRVGRSAPVRDGRRRGAGPVEDEGPVPGPPGRAQGDRRGAATCLWRRG